MRKRSTVHSAVTVVLLALSLVRCDEQALIDRFAGQQETKLAKEDIELLRAKNYPALLARFEPAHRQDPVLVDGLPKAADIFPADEPKNVKVIGYNAFVLKPLNAPSSTTYTLYFEYEFPKSWVIANVKMTAVNSDFFLQAMSVYPLKDSLERANAFTFANKPPLNFAMLVLALMIPVFIVVSLVAAIRTRIPKRKWLWIVFILLGLGRLAINWATGEITTAPLTLYLLGAGFSKDLYGPLVLWVGFPLGAILFWFRRRHWVASSPAEEFS